MSTIEQLEVLCQKARDAGFQVRHEYFGGTGGGICEFAGKRVVFLDLALSSMEQLEKLKETLHQHGLDWTVTKRVA